MPRGPNHYLVLGVARDASSIEIANAVREKLAELKDNPGGASEARAAAVRDAYTVLTNPDTRAEYDAGLPPDPAQAAAQKAANKDPGVIDFVKEVAQEAGLVKVVIPVAVVLMLALVWFKTRPSPAPKPPVVEVTRTSEPEAPRKSEVPPTVVPAPEVARASAPAAATPAATMTAEDVFDAVSGSVARIQTTDASGKSLAQGSGVVIGNTIVVTNCHVVVDAVNISVKVGSDVMPGVIQIADKVYDLCSLRVTGLTATPVTISSSEARVGQRVYAIGAPMGLELTLSEGIVSSLRPTAKGTIIQTTAPISPGSSGGGLFSTSGQLVGIVTFQTRTGQNLNFAVPASWILEMTNRDE